MSHQSFNEFVAQFSLLNAYELDYFSQTFINSYAAIAEADGTPVGEFTRERVLMALSDAMRTLKVELAEAQLKEARHKLDSAHSDTFSPPISPPKDGSKVVNLMHPQDGKASGGNKESDKAPET